jgi:hypothetical protein
MYIQYTDVIEYRCVSGDISHYKLKVPGTFDASKTTTMIFTCIERMGV